MHLNIKKDDEQSDDDAGLFVVAQFSRYQDLEQRLRDHLGDSEMVAQRLKDDHE